MWKRKNIPEPTDESLTSNAKAERLTSDMLTIKDDLEDIRSELGDRIEEVRKAIDEALAR